LQEPSPVGYKRASNDSRKGSARTRKARILLAIAVVGTLAFGQAAGATSGSKASSRSKTSSGSARGHFRPLAPTQHRLHKTAAAAAQPGDSVSQFECHVNGKGLANVNLDCDGIFPNNEPHIAVDPADPGHMVASSNDYESCCDEWYTTFNGGKTWITGDISVEAPGRNKRTGSDPVTSFDRKHNTIIHSSLNYLNFGDCDNPNDVADGDVVVSISQDGGRHWNTVIQVADGGGPTSCESDGIFNDKEWIITDNNPASPHYGTTYLTWTAFFSGGRDGGDEGDGGGGEKGRTTAPAAIGEPGPQSPIYEAHSTDGGFTWSAPQEISGENAALCTFVVAGRANACNDDQFSVPSVARDGSVYVTFINDQNEALWEPGEQFDDQYLVVSSSNGGGSWSDPEFVTGIEDGSGDMPRNVDGRQTLTNQQMRIPFTQGLVADPTHNGRLYLAFADNRNGVHDSANPQTQLDVFLMVKPNAAAPWVGPLNVNSPDNGQIGNDQWFPWVDVNPTDGTVGVIYNDRRYSKHFKRYDATLAKSSAGGTAFTEHRVSTSASHSRGSVFFRAGAPHCMNCTRFHGDYISIAYGSNGRANLVWTDMRDLYAPIGRYLQFIYFARR
jgi:hypothetical protein